MLLSLLSGLYRVHRLRVSSLCHVARWHFLPPLSFQKVFVCCCYCFTVFSLFSSTIRLSFLSLWCRFPTMESGHFLMYDWVKYFHYTRRVTSKQYVAYWRTQTFFNSLSVANFGFIRFVWPCLNDSDDICDLLWRIKCPRNFRPPLWILPYGFVAK